MATPLVVNCPVQTDTRTTRGGDLLAALTSGSTDDENLKRELGPSDSRREVHRASDDPEIPSQTTTEVKRLRHYFGQSSEGIYGFELEPPVSMSLPPDEAISQWLECARLVECNTTFAKMYGYAHPDELIGTPLNPFLSDSPEHNREYLRAFWDSGLDLRDGESQEIDRFGARKYFLNTLFGVVENGHLVRVWGVQRDITEQRSLEQQRRIQQRSLAVEELAAGIAHHFNNMLTIISGNLSLVLEGSALTDGDVDALTSASRAADFAAVLTRQLLTFSQRHQQNSEPVDVATAVKTACQLLRPTLGEQMHLDLDLSEAPHLLADPALIQRLIVKLVEHARRAVNNIGTVKIQLRSLGDDTTSPQLVLRISYPVSPASPLPSNTGLINPYFAGRPAEDLTEVYGIVLNLGGSFSTESSEREMTIALQFSAESSSVAPASQPTERQTSETLETALVVEDDEQVLSVVRRFLLSSGYRVLMAATASESLEILEHHRGTIDVLIVDVVLPDKSGTELAAELLQQRPNLRILLMSGLGRPPGLDAQLAALEVLPKPFSREELEQRLRQLLKRDRSS